MPSAPNNEWVRLTFWIEDDKMYCFFLDDLYVSTATNPQIVPERESFQLKTAFSGIVSVDEILFWDFKLRVDQARALHNVDPDAVVKQNTPVLAG